MRKTIKLIALLLLLALVPAMALAADFAVVRGGRLNLRQYASKTSRSLGKYDSGSWVTVQGQSTSGWYPVRTMDGKTGYMAGNYLTFAQNGSIGTVAYANGGYVNLRQGPSLDYAVVTRVTSGMTVNILDASYEWNYVSVNVGGATYTGYMHDSLINKSTTTATVSTRNGGKVNVRRGPSSSYGSIGSLKSGTRVTVLLKGNGWCQITGGGLTGFMATSYLGNMGTTNSGSNSNSGTVSTRTAYVNNPTSTQVHDDDIGCVEQQLQDAGCSQRQGKHHDALPHLSRHVCHAHAEVRLRDAYADSAGDLYHADPDAAGGIHHADPDAAGGIHHAEAGWTWHAHVRLGHHPGGGLRQFEQHDQRLL